MDSSQSQIVSIVVPVYQAEKFIGPLLERISNVRDKLITFDILIAEVILVCDEPIDLSLATINKIKKEKEYDFVTAIELGFNVGQHLATSAGILCARGDWIVTLDEDLQHPPELIPQILYDAQNSGLDVVYVKNKTKAHKHSVYRDFTSRLAKSMVNSLTGLDVRNVSSYRCIRSQLAKSCASSMDKFQYFDILLQFLTSKRRRGAIYCEMSDLRANSGYTLPRLFKHFSKLTFSSLLSGSRVFLVLLFPIILVFTIGLVFISIAIGANTATYAPGWLSIFAMLLLLSIIQVAILAVLAKTSSILMLRAIAPPAFFVVNRGPDKYWAQKLASLVNR